MSYSIGSEVNGSYFHDDFNITTRIQDFVNVSYEVIGTGISNSTNSTGYDNDYNWTSLINTTGLSDGLYTIRYTAKDSVNNIANESLQFYVDRHAWFNSSNPISNYSWIEDSNLTNAFNLSDHFVNTSGVTYTTTGNSRISVFISNHSVTFVPDDDWYGVEYVTFYASDPYGVVQSSNNITLTVTDDYCNPPSSGTWNVNQTQVAQCRSGDQDLLNKLSNITVVENSTLNITNMRINSPIYFFDNSTGYSRNNVFTKTVYLKENSTLT